MTDPRTGEDVEATPETQEAADIFTFQSRLRALTPRAYATAAIIAANVLVFLLMLAVGYGLIDPDPQIALAWGADYGPLTISGQWWRLITSAFIHFGVLHIAFNMLALVTVGDTVERIYGNGRFVLLYVFSALTGSLASLLWNQYVLSAGASGAIFGLYGALVAFLKSPRNTFGATVDSKLWKGSVPFIGYNLLNGFTHSGIDNAAHVGGLIGGFLLGLVLSRPLTTERSAGDRPRFLLATVGGISAIVLMWAAVPKDIQRFQEDLSWFENEFKDLGAIYDDLERQLEAGAISDDFFAEQLDSTVAPRVKAAAERMERASESTKVHYKSFFDFLNLYSSGMAELDGGAKRHDENAMNEGSKKLDRALSLMKTGEEQTQ